MKKQLSANFIRNTLLAILWMGLIPQLSFAQTGTIQGKVIDDGGSPVVGASVVVLGTTKGTTTDVNGAYSFNFNPGTFTIQISSIGYKSATLTVTVVAGQTSTLDVTLSEGTEILNNIIISATRQPIRKIETTTAVDVLDSKALANLTPPSISESIRNIPGVFVENYTGRIRTNIMMRGFPDGTVNSVKYSGLLVDGLPAYASPAEPVDAYIKFDKNIERIEVVRGSAATLFGKSTAAGVVNLISKVGGEKLSGTAQVTLGNNVTESQSGLMTQYDLNLNGAITKRLRFNIGGFYVNDPGFRDSGFPDKGYQIRANLDYLLGDNGSKGSIRVYGGRIDIDVQNHVYIPYRISDLKPYRGFNNASSVWAASQNSVTYQQYNDAGDQIETRVLGDNLERGNFSDGYHIGTRINLNLGNWTITNNFRRQEVELGNNFNISTRYNAPTATVASITGDLFQFVGNTENEDWIDELQIRNQFYTGKVKHSITIGGYYSLNINRPKGQAFLSNPFNIDAFTNGQGQLIPRNTFLNTSTGTAVTNILAFVPVHRFEQATNYALFLGDEIAFSQKFRVDFGIRYDWNQLKIDVYNVPGTSPFPGGPPIASPYRFPREVNTIRTVPLPEYSAFSGSLGANYLLGESSAIYLNLVRAFRLPDEDTFTGAQPVPADQRDKLKETITNIELGYRGALADGDLNFSFTHFYTNIENLLNSIFNAFTSTFEVRPEGSIAIFGTEFGLNYTPSGFKGFQLNANFTSQSSRYTSFKNFRNPGDTQDQDVSGNQVQRIPTILFNLGFVYDHKFFGLNFNTNFVGGRRYFEPTNLLEMRDIVLVTTGAYVKYGFGKVGTVRLGLNVTNLFNTDAPVILSSADVANALRGIKDGGAGLVAGTPTLPRRLLFSLAYTF